MFYMGGCRKFCQRGRNFDNVLGFFVLVDEGRDNQNTTKSGPSSAHKRNAILNGVSLAGQRWPNIEC